MNSSRVHIQNFKTILLLTISLIATYGCTPPITDPKIVAEIEIMGKWDWVKTVDLGRGFTETPDSLGYNYKVEIDGVAWVRFRDGIRDAQYMYSIEYAENVPPSLHTDAPFVLMLHGGQYWDYVIDNDSLTMTILSTRELIDYYVRSN